jgi:S-DNA-T family DNA segregation ATPase FtsK/SpoIIIE
VITGGRSLLTGRIASVAGERIVLRLADSADYLMLGVARRDLPGELPPGRGIRASDLALVQAASVEAADLRAATRWPAPKRPPEAFAALPQRVRLNELCGSGASDSIVVGVRAADHAAIRLSRTECGDVFLVAGARRSGRSTALRLIAGQLSDRPVVVVARRCSPLAECHRAITLDPDDPQHALEVIDRLAGASQRPHLLVDDIDQLAPGGLLDRIDQLMRDHDRDAVVAVSATIDSAAAAFRGPLSTARQSRRGLLLQPLSSRDGDVLGVDLRRQSLGADPPGRGWLVIDGVGSRLQVAEPDPHPQPSTEFELSAFGDRRRE